MPWKGVAVIEQRQRFLEDYQLNYYSIHDRSRRPHSCPWQTAQAIAKELVKLRKAHPRWWPRKLLDLMQAIPVMRM